MKLRRVPFLLLPLLAGAPMRPADGSPAPQLTVDLRSRQLQPAPDEPWTKAAGGEGRVEVEGAVTTPTPCYTLAGEARRDGQTVTLTLQAERKEGGCIQVIAAFGYEATVRGLPPGRYTLRVLHAYPGTGWERRTALEQAVEVR